LRVTIGSVILAFLAGTLSILSPCVLPILPVVLGTAVSNHRFGPVVLAGGLSISFVAIGLFIATVGFSIGLDADVFRYAAAVLIIVLGAILLLPAIQVRLATASGPIANWTDQHFGNKHGSGLSGQFWVGVLLGAVWSPCVGPTLGAASLLAAQGRDFSQVAITMLAFGVGAALPLLALGIVSREAMLRWRSHLVSAGQGMKVGFGLVLLAIGALVLSGLDMSLETVLVNASPQWLTDLATRL
jgi:cytochrome c-type biogenesis protein